MTLLPENRSMPADIYGDGKMQWEGVAWIEDECASVQRVLRRSASPT